MSSIAPSPPSAVRGSAARRRRLATAVFELTLLTAALPAAPPVWQWSVPMGEGRAFLWIPEDCRQVRAVVVAQDNMIEPGILEHPAMRGTLAELGCAAVLVAPPFDRVFAFDQGAGGRFDVLMRALADECGYDELATAPVVPMGHSACASFPWNFAAWNPDRTLAILSLKGDAPLTDLTGSGAPNPDWGGRRIDGIPGLLVMSEQEWWEDRLTPLVKFRSVHPAAPLAVLADTGHGHFDATDGLVEYVAMFLRKAAEARLPELDDAGGALRPDNPSSGADRGVTPLRPKIDPARGWLLDRWRGAEPPRAMAAPWTEYAGDRTEAFWCFDEAMARSTETYQSRGRGLRVQQVAFRQAGEFAPISTSHAGVELEFLPEPDGITFRLSAGFIAPLPPRPPVAAKDRPPPVATVRPVAAEPGTHADGDVQVSVIAGPAGSLDGDRFRVAYSRTRPPGGPRSDEIWLLARHPGDARHKGAVQQGRLRLPRSNAGRSQVITFPAIRDRPAGEPGAVPLAASTDAGARVGYYVREGPAYVVGEQLHFTPAPPRTRWPVRVTVVAWQFGRGGESRLRAAAPVERSFLLTAP